jgi:hypothetical protein
MLYATDALPFLLVIGAVDAPGYKPPAVTVPAVVLNRGTVITVTNATMATRHRLARWLPIRARTEFLYRKRSSLLITTRALGTSSSPLL